MNSIITKLDASAVLLHGCFLQAQFREKYTWEHLCWGNDASGPPNLRGRGVAAILTAFQQNADVLFLPAGNSVRDELNEGAYTQKFFLSRAPELAVYLRGYENEISAEWIRKLLENAVTRIPARNTREEFDGVLKECLNHGISTLYSVTNAFHGPRTYQTGTMALSQVRQSYERKHDSALKFTLMFPASREIDGDARDTVVLEEDHKPGKPGRPSLATIGRALLLLDDEGCELVVKVINTTRRRLGFGPLQ